MFQTEFGKPILGVLLLTIFLSACEIVQTSPKYTLKGTTTKTPFHIKSTFTPTKEPPPTYTPSDTPTLTPTFTPTYTPTETPWGTETPTPEPTTNPLPTPTPTSTPKNKNNEDTKKIIVSKL